VLHVTTPVDQDTYLTADVGADLAEMSRELVAQQSISRQASAKETLELMHLTGLEATGITEDLDGGKLPVRQLGVDAQNDRVNRRAGW